VIGAAVRTRKGVKPIFVSVGHRVSLASAVALVMQCTLRGRRLPEPTRLAHLAAGSKE
jgi:deoxyribonuclease V